MADFDISKVKVKNRFSSIHRKGTPSHQTASFEILRIKFGSVVLAVRLPQSVKS